jgi:AcrR family transcriptional regulator
MMQIDIFVALGHNARHDTHYPGQGAAIPVTTEQSSNSPAAPPTRGARRKQRTRDKLMRAALQLMGEKGPEGVAINEITEAADVGFGSFYNHFESKEALYEALLEDFFESFGAALQRITETHEDPAAILATSIRCTFRQARENPDWARFLLRTGFSTQVFSHGLGHHVLRDLQAGTAGSRFQVDDLLMALIATGGTVMAAISVDLARREPGNAWQAEVGRLGLEDDNLPQRTSAAVLRALGLSGQEAKAISELPLPDVDFAPGPLGA